MLEKKWVRTALYLAAGALARRKEKEDSSCA